jgi:hypothetical protein
MCFRIAASDPEITHAFPLHTTALGDEYAKHPITFDSRSDITSNSYFCATVGLPLASQIKLYLSDSIDAI